MADDIKSKTLQLRRDHILDCAIKVFDTDGFRGATIHTIAQAAGVSDGTVYNVFENKEDILLAVLKRLLVASNPAPAAPALPLEIDTLLRTMIASRWNDTTPQVLSMMRVVWSEALIHRELANRYSETILAPALAMPEPLFQALSDNKQMTETDIPMAIRTVVATFLGFTLLKLLGDPVVNERSSDVPAQMAEILIAGLKTRGSHDTV